MKSNNLDIWRDKQRKISQRWHDRQRKSYRRYRMERQLTAFVRTFGVGATTMILAITSAIVVAFILVNFMTGCETWDETRWTAHNSCVTPTAIWESFNELHVK